MNAVPAHVNGHAARLDLDATGARCALCRCRLDESVDARARARGVCNECLLRPEARRLSAPGAAPRAPSVSDRGARAFTPAERALIRKVHGYLPATQLLGVLNERLVCDLGPDAARYTMEQLHAELHDAAAVTPSEASDWAGLRKILAHARATGLMARVTPELIDDFAVVFSLAPAQVVRLKDVLLATDDGEGEA